MGRTATAVAVVVAFLVATESSAFAGFTNTGYDPALSAQVVDAAPLGWSPLPQSDLQSALDQGGSVQIGGGWAWLHRVANGAKAWRGPDGVLAIVLVRFTGLVTESTTGDVAQICPPSSVVHVPGLEDGAAALCAVGGTGGVGVVLGQKGSTFIGVIATGLDLQQLETIAERQHDALPNSPFAPFNKSWWRLILSLFVVSSLVGVLFGLAFDTYLGLPFNIIVLIVGLVVVGLGLILGSVLGYRLRNLRRPAPSPVVEYAPGVRSTHATIMSSWLPSAPKGDERHAVVGGGGSFGGAHAGGGYAPPVEVERAQEVPLPAFSGQALASWLPDPTGRHEHRYFDGSAWTDNVSDHGTASVDPM